MGECQSFWFQYQYTDDSTSYCNLSVIVHSKCVAGLIVSREEIKLKKKIQGMCQNINVEIFVFPILLQSLLRIFWLDACWLQIPRNCNYVKKITGAEDPRKSATAKCSYYKKWVFSRDRYSEFATFATSRESMHLVFLTMKRDDWICDS